MPEDKTIFFSVMQSPVGPLLLAAGQDGLRHLQFHRGQLPGPEPLEPQPLPRQPLYLTCRHVYIIPCSW